MAKWLNKYFSLGNNKTKSPPQPPRPDYREKRNGAGGAPRPDGPPHLHLRHHTSPSFPRRRLRDEASDLLRAYRAQKDRDFEDPYSGPGSSLCRLRAMCRPDYAVPEELGEAAPKAFSSASCRAAPPAPCAAGSPHLFRSHSERRPATPPDVKYVSPKHRLIKVEGVGGSDGKKLNKGSEQLATSVPAAVKDKVLIADDYSDPFDAKSELNRMGKGENTGYMEPYEAQRIMTEFAKQEGVKSHQKNMQLYDIPYEPEGSAVESDSESVVSHHLRESKLPQDDDRPADEYDQPWEWNKVTIPALAAQFNGSEKRQASPPSNDQRRQLRAPGGGFKPIKHGSPEFCGILGERIDPTVQLEKQIWYHGAISRTDAENLLRLCKECSYLVRNSQTSKHDYSLSLKRVRYLVCSANSHIELRSSQGFMHMKLMKTKDKYILGQNSPPFDSVPEVIHYYTTKKLPIKGAEHLSLLYPVAVRTL
ncbi:SH2 domain-containing adapter protein B isoform X1 [Falco biarmicus]|uniref:SH2 domain-containing adapter protein B isoform X1 n=1 Tax=Falco peregrinus TaxID=8954 RepID=UPI0018867F95|nr:SH2 domain-containing adapter protein B isoform X1 [Falco peregrinus]XP_027671983.2 SH2 domain-containing adapter protein B isoform X1 [Falco cherrug]XP_037229863.1 SH2 domain-containing adapter protein B isoform X1 [Falco rusticolus]XP_040436131.1 SH2 domain-containing adapter protein B isoform X1 [Falco naumanni]XP_056181125.1 SH2 domain-containing adapter protein B isoform X1 [Falco biarmicus]